MNKDQNSSGVGRMFLILTALFMVWFADSTARIEDQKVKKEDVVVRLAVAKTGDILQFSDGRRCQVVADRGRDTIEIHYTCADDPYTVVTTKINDLVLQVEAVFPLVDQAMVFADLTIRRHSRDGGIPELSRP